MKKEKTIIKMNDDNNYLSLGNFFRIIKEIVTDKNIANQQKIFYAITNIKNINNQVINNYCTGYRGIGKEYKEIIKKKQLEYQKDKNNMITILSNITNIVNETDNVTFTKELINNNNNIKILSEKLYHIILNDKNITNEDQTKFKEYIEQRDFYSYLSEIIFYIFLKNIQPIYIENIIIKITEDYINKTSIPTNDIIDYINIKLNNEINYTHSLKKLANQNNTYACYELGLNFHEKKEYQKSYNYFKIAADKNHPKANYYIAKMLLNGTLGSNAKEDINEALKYATKATQLGNIEANNLIGLIYLRYKKDKEKAIYYFKIAADKEYPYAYNNLGILKEKEKVYQQAFDYYLKSAKLEEGWACNKIAEFYRQGIGTPKNQNKAFYYYNLALENKNLNWPKYNLAMYFYLFGNYQANIEKNELLAIKLFKESANENNIKSTIYLIEYYTEKYFNERNKQYLKEIYNYITKLEKHKDYNIEYKKQIENTIKKIKNKKEITINLS